MLSGDKDLKKKKIELVDPMDFSCGCDKIPEEDRAINWATKYGFCCSKKYREAMHKYRLWSDTDPHLEELSGGMKSARTKARNKMEESLEAWKEANR